MATRGTLSALSYFLAFPQRCEKNCALTLCVRGEEFRHVIIEERKAGCPEMQRIGGEIHLAAEDSGFELNSAVSAVA